MSATCYLLDFSVQPTKYQRWYDAIIANRQSNPISKDEYGEVHHIIPTSLGGSDEQSNLVLLTAREHFIVHWLLVKIHSKGPTHRKMVHALGLMMWMTSSTQERYRLTGRTFENLRRRYAIQRSKDSKGSGNTQFGTMWITNGAKNIKIKKDDQIPDGFWKGRTLIPRLKLAVKKCGKCSTVKSEKIEENSKIQKKIAEKWYPKYLEYGSINMMCKSEDVEVSSVILGKYFKKHLNLNLSQGTCLSRKR